MNRCGKIAILIFVLILCFAVTAFAENRINTDFDGETSRESTELHEGVTMTHITTGDESKYGKQDINIISFDLFQSDLCLDAAGGEYLDTLSTVSDTLGAWAEQNTDKTPICAVNGDLWMMSSAHGRVLGSGTVYGGCDNPVVTSSLTVPRGFNIYDGEIVCSDYMYQETPYEGDFWAFGVSSDSVPLIGCPTLDIKLNCNGVYSQADGLNRLPADNALVVYSDKGPLNCYALDDSYEIVLQCDDYTVKHGEIITGTIKSICEGTHPDIEENQIILCARGNAISKIQSYNIGDTVEISFTVGEKYGRNKEKWQSAITAVGGHMPFVVDGVKCETGTTVGYPTTIVGIDNEGKVVMLVNDGRQRGYSNGLDFKDYWALTDDLDLNSAIILDGGGSSTLVTCDGSDYNLQNRPSDGHQRRVVNSLILSSKQENQSKGKCDLSLPTSELDFKYLDFTKPEYFSLLTVSSQTRASSTEEGAEFTVNDYNGDAFFTISFGMPGNYSENPYSLLYGINYPYLDVSEYPYMVLDIKMNSGDPSVYQFQSIYAAAGNTIGHSGATFAGYNNVKNDGVFARYIIDLSEMCDTGDRLNTIRVSYLLPVNGCTVEDGDSMVLRSVKFAETYEKAVSTGEKLPFNDVKNTSWYFNAVRYSYDRGYISGMSRDTFGVNEKMNRAMIVTVLARIMNADTDGYEGTSFTDVKAGQWYTKNIEWAYQTGLVSGYGNTFGYADPVTREQVACIMYRMLVLREFIEDKAQDKTGISTFIDFSEISPWAENQLCWAVNNGIIAGDGSMLHPSDTATRTEVTQMFYKMVSEFID